MMLALNAIERHRLLPLRTLGAIALAAAVILGLLAMHVLSGPAGAHHSAVASGSATSVAVLSDSGSHAGITQAASTGHGVDSEAVCDCDEVMLATTPVSVHSMLVMACVLAVLAVALLLVPPGRSAAMLIPGRAFFAGPRLSDVARARAPSLFVLSISRT
ncbi:hypothetical protein FVP74_07630 [Microbacterium saccharophilum]|uniref:Uncharacterized protein n=1 Tax=Microbacterium saccharophilum TaxID=1213358 RepID=A0A5C8I0L0_9MICO|nr:DUF6153 family protein [Microbacterium saccharophilum]TXK11209.1 hypothetical protein FVP74_07630 [Microbacterium saccharophilum]GEP49122.1 hypothetical protein MSA03_26300 [Microbacterium saccharophilum]